MKKVLDATCGSRMMWFDKSDERAVFTDKRTESHVLCDGRALEIAPDIEADFTSLPFADGTFSLVVLDPPHLKKAGENSWLRKKYGVLPMDWRGMIRDGVAECMRVLKDDGVLILKWNEDQVKVSDVVKAAGHAPLFGHPTKRGGTTIWMTFIKTNNEK